jgi:hypothetical protein
LLYLAFEGGKITLKKNKSMKIENKNVLLYSSINTQNERAISQKYTCQ